MSCATCGAAPVGRFPDGSPAYPPTCSHPPIRGLLDEPPPTLAPPVSARRRHALKRGAVEKQLGSRDDPSWIVYMGEKAEWAAAAVLTEAKHRIAKLGRDPGWDLTLHGWLVDVKWSSDLRRCLLVSADIKLVADVYVLVVGRDETRLEVVGWTWRSRVIQCPVEHLARNGRPSYCYPTTDLLPIESLISGSRDNPKGGSPG